MGSEKNERLKPMVITDPDEGREYTLALDAWTYTVLFRVLGSLVCTSDAGMKPLPLPLFTYMKPFLT